MHINTWYWVHLQPEQRSDEPGLKTLTSIPIILLSRFILVETLGQFFFSFSHSELSWHCVCVSVCVCVCVRVCGCEHTSVHVRHVSGVRTHTHTDGWRHAMCIRKAFACECRECLSAPPTDSWTIHPALIEFAHTLGRSGGGKKTKTQETEKENTLHTIICFPVSPPDTGKIEAEY